MKTNQNQVTQTERQKAKAIAQALSGGSKARAGRMEVSIMAVLAAFGGTITHFELAQPSAYAPTDYTQDPEAETLSAQ